MLPTKPIVRHPTRFVRGRHSRLELLDQVLDPLWSRGTDPPVYDNARSALLEATGYAPSSRVVQSHLKRPSSQHSTLRGSFSSSQPNLEASKPGLTRVGGAELESTRDFAQDRTYKTQTEKKATMRDPALAAVLSMIIHDIGPSYLQNGEISEWSRGDSNP